MPMEKTVNGYLIRAEADGNWWIIGIGDEKVAGPFSDERQAGEVAAVLQDLPAKPVRQKKPRP